MKKSYDLSLKTEETKRQQQARTNSVCYELLNAFFGNHKAISKLWTMDYERTIYVHQTH